MTKTIEMTQTDRPQPETIEWHPDKPANIANATPGTQLMIRSVVEHLERRRREYPGEWTPFDEQAEDAYASAIIAGWSCGMIRVRVFYASDGTAHFFAAAK